MIIAYLFTLVRADTDCSSESFSCAAIEQNCTLGLVIQIFNGSYDAGVDVVFPHSCP